MFYLLREFLLWASEQTKLPIEQVQFIFCMLLNFPLGAVYRTLLHPRRVSPEVRLLVSLTWGLIIGWICFGSELLRLIVVSTLCYGLTWRVNPKDVHKVVFVVSFICLSAAQLYRMFVEYGINRFDYSGRLMVITQKVTYVAFSLHDGLGRKENELTEEQKEHRIKRMPSFLEYYGYIFHHSMLLVGPVCSYKEYIDFIEGRDIAQATIKGHKEPSPTVPTLQKLASSLLCVILFLLGSKVFPFELNADPYFIANSSFLWRMAVSFFIMFIARLKYYFAWIIADAGNNACGLGFNGYDAKGEELWNGVTNVNVIVIETSTNFRRMIQNWNMTTNLWLRRTVYDRVPHLPPYQRTLVTYVVSTIWHGFYPGYYLTFIVAVLIVVATRKVRYAFGHFFQISSPVINSLVELLKWVTCNVVFGSYGFTPFLLLRLDLSLTFYRSTYFIVHILLIGAIIFIPGGRPKPSHEAKAVNGAVTSQQARQEVQTESNKDVSVTRIANNNALFRHSRSAKLS
ncbi:lysophospholipid acyltransferase 1-like isoform X1 [Porites lutea]|uniref:lysophospholipid acyltransferase 1-like isoform X1 n=1 Tax=Porites lutea TaxID=51062 RepID=UPI003CC51CBD